MELGRLHRSAYPAGVQEELLSAGTVAGSPHLGPEVGKSPGNVTGSSNIATFGQTWLNEYFSRLAIFIPLLACRINCVANFSLGAALTHSRIPI